MSIVTGIKCPSCGASMSLKSGGVIVCSHCGTTSMVQRPAPAQSARAMRRELKAAEEDVQHRLNRARNDREVMRSLKPAMGKIHLQVVLCAAFLCGMALWVWADGWLVCGSGWFLIAAAVAIFWPLNILFERGRTILRYNSAYEHTHDAEQAADLGQAQTTAAELRRRLSDEEGQE